MNTEKPSWFRKKERSINSTGTLDLSGETLADLSWVPSRILLKNLDISFCSVTSFEGLAVEPKIDYINAYSSALETFANAKAIKTISKITLKNTPVSNVPNYKISLLLICDNLRVIDNCVVPTKLKNRAAQYPPVAAELVNKGWMAEYPCPDEEVLMRLCEQYGVQIMDEEDLPPPSLLFMPDTDIDTLINQYKQKHDEMVQKAETKLHLPYDAEEDVQSTSTDAEVTEDRFSNSQIESEEEDAYTENQSTQSEFIDEDDPNLLSNRLREVLNHYNFTVESGDKIESILASLESVFYQIEEHPNGPVFSTDHKQDAIDDEEEEEEEDSDSFDDIDGSSPVKAKPKDTPPPEEKMKVTFKPFPIIPHPEEKKPQPINDFQNDQEGLHIHDKNRNIQEELLLDDEAEEEEEDIPSSDIE